MNPKLKLCTADLRNHLVLLEKITSKDAAGGQLPVTLNPVADMYGKISQLSAGDPRRGSQESPEATHKITMRYFNEVTPFKALEFGDRRFDIVSVDNIEERNLVMEVIVREVVSTQGTPI
jgi:head-tail adaptor